MAIPCIKNFWLAPPYCKTYEESSDSDLDEFFDEEDIAYKPKIEVSNPSKLLNLIENLTDKSTKKLETKLNLYIKVETESKFIFIVTINSITYEASVQVLQQKTLKPLCKVELSDEAIQDLYGYQTNPFTTDLHPQIILLLEQVASGLGESIIVPVFLTEKKSKAGTRFPAFLVCCVKSKKDSTFVSKLISETFAYCGHLLLNTRTCEEEKHLKAECQKLLVAGKNIFLKIKNLNKLIKEILCEGRTLTDCERCTLFLINPDNMNIIAKVFDTNNPLVNSQTPIRIEPNQGIPGYVAATGKMINIENVEAHPLYVKGNEEFKIRNTLCCPVEHEAKILGVIQLYNKLSGKFTRYDESILHAICIYCGIAVNYGIEYKQLNILIKSHEVVTNILVQNIVVTDQAIIQASMCPSHHADAGFDTFQFSTRKILDKETPCFVIKMFHDLGFINEFQIKVDHLAKFTLYVKKSYLDLPYFNWQRAFRCTHFLFVCIKKFEVLENNLLSKIEIMACLIASLCHDINYKSSPRNVTEISDCLIANIYSSEENLMKRIQADNALNFFNVKDCNFLQNLPSEDYKQFLNLVKDLILATDLANHYRIHSRQLAMSLQGFDSTPENKFYLSTLLMTCADFSEHTEDWTESKRAAQLIYSQFFADETLQRKVLDPDNDKAVLYENVANDQQKQGLSIPELQLKFLNECVICIFKILAKLFPAAICLVEALQNNILCWEASKSLYEKMKLDGKTSIEILTSIEIENKVSKILEQLKVRENVI